MARQVYPAEFRRRVLELVGSGRRIADVAADLGISTPSCHPMMRFPSTYLVTLLWS